MKVKEVSSAECAQIVERLKTAPFSMEINDTKNTINYFLEEEKCLSIRAPFFWTDLLQPLTNTLDNFNYALLMVRSGIASIGYFENGENMDHKVFRAYMVRKKQGKSQIKYLKTKGKSRAGSRVRLAETLEFFEEINERLAYYEQTFRIDKLGLACATTLIPYLFDASKVLPIPKKDLRWAKIPKHIGNPTYESLLETNQFLLRGTISYDIRFASWVEGQASSGPKETEQNEDLDDW
ncbi:hypothetical protein GCM10007049_07810 [Echinicola pacifica]|uniref:VLRF1 domain-containing protein n=1 Tax=Echinicola pacifica TaxID=346377 RepID=A0A918PPI0_9BACT|nr:hypothetical protein [Echinicola pacifica]GGZ17619.1 hypothetical protein GCM10007049_07810 [Echinicola pacifica]